MAEARQLAAVILAAGAGRRLGGVAKALIEDAGRTLLAAIVERACAAGTVHLEVVVGPPFGDAVAAHARAVGAGVAINTDPTRGMASSVAVGFQALIERAPSACIAAWLWPVDHAWVAPGTLAALVEAQQASAIVRPVHRGRGGHPPLVGRAHWSALASCADHRDGARGVLHELGMVDVAVEDPGCLRDLDTPRDREVQP